jgi:hypothetical protein
MSDLLMKQKITLSKFDGVIQTMVKDEFKPKLVCSKYNEHGTPMTLFYIQDADVRELHGKEYRLDRHIGTFCKGEGWIFKSALPWLK